MQWSAVRVRALKFLAPSIRARVDFHSSKYRSGGRTWLSVDGRDILSVTDEFRRFLGPAPLGPNTLGDVLYHYPSLPFEGILKHHDPMVRAIGMLDERLGKRRLKTIDVSEEHPLVQALHALRREAEGLPLEETPEFLAVGATQLTRRLKRAEKAARRLGSLAGDVAAAALLSARRRGEDPKGLIRAFQRGEVPGAPPATPITRLLNESLEADDDPHALAAALSSLAARTKLFKRAEHVRGVVNLWRHRKDWLKTLETWTAPPRSATRQFTDLAEHLFARHPVPPFMNEAWFDGDPKHLAWYRHIGATGTILGAPNLPFPLTKKQARFFLGAPADYSVGAALRWAQVRALDGDPRMADHLRGTRLEREFGNEGFWNSVLRFFVDNPMLDPVHYGPIVDFLHHRRFEWRRVFEEEGVVRELPPEQPALTMRGRTAGALLREVEAWHGRLAREGTAAGLRWRASGILSFEEVSGTPEGRNMKVWRIRELLSGTALNEEGLEMGHCVASYARSCAEGASSIWTLEREDAGGVEKRLTVEVANARRQVAQARGRLNRLPQPEETEVLHRWAAQAGLTFRLFR